MHDTNKFIKQIKITLNESGGEAYLVGGFIREKLINFKNNPKNLEIIYDGNVNKFIFLLNNNGYKFEIIEKDKKSYRCKYGNMAFNITLMKENSIEENLNKRDFTINTICMKLSQNKIIDPFRGRRAIQCRIIQNVNDKSIEEDPVRILRGIRFYIKYGMHFNLETEERIVKFAPALKNCDKGRVLKEFMELVESDINGNAFEILNNYNILKNIIPCVGEFLNEILSKRKEYKQFIENNKI